MIEVRFCVQCLGNALVDLIPCQLLITHNLERLTDSLRITQ
jgi:hypothetical protein